MVGESLRPAPIRPNSTKDYLYNAERYRFPPGGNGLRTVTRRRRFRDKLFPDEWEVDYRVHDEHGIGPRASNVVRIARLHLKVKSA